MPKSKGSKAKKGKKGKPLTEEEKRKVAEAKALAEREKLIARQNLTRAWLKVKKDKEYELIKLNENKILALWRPLLRKSKLQELLEDYQRMKGAFQRSYDKKSQWLSDMAKQMKLNEGDYNEAANSHLLQIDRIMEFYEKRLGEVVRMFDEAKGQLYSTFEYERRQIQKSHQEKLNGYRKAMKKLTDNVSKLDHEARLQQYEILVDLRTQGSHDLYLYRTQTNEKMTQVWNSLHTKLLEYLKTNEDKKRDLVEALNADEKMAASINVLYQKRAFLIAAIKRVKKRRAIFAETYQIHITNLRKIRDTRKIIYERLHTLRHQNLKRSGDALQDLALNVHDVHQKTQFWLTKREKLVTLVKRILEEENATEKLDPFLQRWGFQNEFKVMSNIPKSNHPVECDCVNCNCDEGGFNTSKYDFAKSEMKLEHSRSKRSDFTSSHDGLCCHDHGGIKTSKTDLNLKKDKFGIDVKIPSHEISCDCVTCECDVPGKNNTNTEEINNFAIKVEKPDHLMDCECENCICIKQKKEKPAFCQLIPKDVQFQLKIKKPDHKIPCDCEECHCKTISQQKEEPDEIGKIVNLYNQAEGFWIRFSKVMLEYEFYVRKRSEIMEDNEKLKFLLKQYMKGFNPPSLEIVGSETLDEVTLKVKDYMIELLNTKQRARLR